MTKLMRRSCRAFGLFLGSLAATQSHAIEFGYSTALNDHLYQINLTTGQATDLGPIDLLQTEGMAFNGASLLGIGGLTDLQNPQPQQLWNLTTPPGSSIGDTEVSTQDDSGLDAHNGELWAVQGNIFGSQILKLDPSDGSTIQGQSAPIMGVDFLDSLAIDSNGNAFAVDPSFTGSLYSLDLSGTLGNATIIGTGLGITGNFNSGLAFSANDTLYMLLSDGSLFTVNTLNGLASFVADVNEGGNPLDFHGGFAIGDFDAAAIIPEPATMVMVMIGAGVMLVRPRARPCAEPSGRR